MAKGNPLVQFRLPQETYDWLKKRGPRASEVAKRIVLDAALEEGNKGGSGLPGRTGASDDSPSPSSSAETLFEQAARLKQEWEDMERAHPQLAAEFGSYDEYARRQGE